LVAFVHAVHGGSSTVSGLPTHEFAGAVRNFCGA
jgi:hypothetical protein